MSLVLSLLGADESHLAMYISLGSYWWCRYGAAHTHHHTHSPTLTPTLTPKNYQANIERADSFNTRSTSGTVEDVMERLEFGSFQVGLTFACGLTFMSDAVQINLM